MSSSQRLHDEAWLLLPWLANGCFSSEQVWVEEYVRSCAWSVAG